MATREEYVEKMKSQLDEWNSDLDNLERKYHEASDETKRRLEPHLQKVREARDTTRAKIKELKDSGEASWDAAVDEVEHVWKTFKQSVNYFKSQL
jgi:predicted  nucleic acid-binding Zn-ribbon protein